VWAGDSFSTWHSAGTFSVLAAIHRVARDETEHCRLETATPPLIRARMRAAGRGDMGGRGGCARLVGPPEHSAAGVEGDHDALGAPDQPQPHQVVERARKVWPLEGNGPRRRHLLGRQMQSDERAIPLLNQSPRVSHARFVVARWEKEPPRQESRPHWSACFVLAPMLAMT